MLLEGTHFSHYRLQSLLGRGGMGEVYLAEDTRITRQVAVKVVHGEIESIQNATIAQEIMRLFQREMVVVASLDHPHILPLIDFGEENLHNTSYAYLVTPYRPEGSLTTWLQQYADELLSIEDVVHLVVQAADALHYAHEHHIVHMDVKASNFLVRSRGTTRQRPDILLADFGISRFNDVAAGASRSVRGTPSAMAPEQWTGDAVPATDQYALAVMAYHLLTGVFPFQGTMQQLMYQHLETVPHPPGSHNARLSPAIDAVILRALAKKPAERFPSIHVFSTAFQQACMAGLDPSTHGNNYLPTLSTAWSLAERHPVLSTEQQPVQNPLHSHALAPGNAANTLTYITPVHTPARRVAPGRRSIFLRTLLAICLILLLGTATILAFPALHTLYLPVNAPAANPTPASSQTQIPYGRLLYTTATLGSTCGTSWSDYRQPSWQCASHNTSMTNTYTSPGLMGTTLTALPNMGTNADNYVLEAQIQQTTTSADFGIGFRNQPGNLLGIYTFLLRKDGSWHHYMYDDAVGTQIQVASGITTLDLHSRLVLTVVANAANFTFYINGTEVGSDYDGTYKNGTAGIYIGAGGTVVVSKFSIYSIK